MVARSFIIFCEKLWASWLAGELQLPKSVTARFQLTHAPEPYIRFGEGTKPVFFLLTNPGDGRFPEQERASILAGNYCVSRQLSYYEAALKYGTFYQEKLKNAAGTRIKAMARLSKLLGGDCFIQFESIPFHSSKLPGKRRLPDLVSKTPILAEYCQCLTAALSPFDVPAVVVLSGVGSSQSISSSSLDSSLWLKWQSNLLEVRSKDLKVKHLLRKGDKTTVAFLYKQVRNHIRGFVLSMGHNGFPSKQGLDEISSTLEISAANEGA